MSERKDTIRSRTADHDRPPMVECRRAIWKLQHTWKLESGEGIRIRGRIIASNW